MAHRILLLVLLLVDTMPAGESSVLVNGGFEDGLTGWSTAGPVVLERAMPITGGASARLGPGPAALRQRFPADNTDHFSIKAVFRPEPAGAGSLAIRCLDQQGREVMALHSPEDMPTARHQPGGSLSCYFRPHPLTASIEIVLSTRDAAAQAVVDQVVVEDYAARTTAPPPTCDPTAYMQPFWQGGTIHDETVLLVADGERPASGRLLFAPTRIRAVRHLATGAAFTAGTDFTLAGRTLTAIPSSRIPQVRADEFPSGDLKWFKMGGRAVVVTYDHEGRWDGPVPAFAGQHLPHTMEALRGRRPLTVVAYGDSITFGINVSRTLRQAPYMPTWAELFVGGLKAIYRHEGIHLHNAAQSGADSAWAARMATRMVASLDPDLVLIAFGMNDFWGTSAKDFHARIAHIIADVRARRPAVEFVLVASMRFDPAYTEDPRYRTLADRYVTELAGLCGPGVQMLDMNAISAALYAAKKPRDCITDPLHPNDFLARWYAQGLVAMLDDAAH